MAPPHGRNFHFFRRFVSGQSVRGAVLRHGLRRQVRRDSDRYDEGLANDGALHTPRSQGKWMSDPGIPSAKIVPPITPYETKMKVKRDFWRGSHIESSVEASPYRPQESIFAPRESNHSVSRPALPKRPGLLGTQESMDTEDRSSIVGDKLHSLGCRFHHTLGAAGATARPKSPRAASSIRDPAEVPIVPNFDKTAQCFLSFSFADLLRAYLVQRICAIKPLVQNSERLLRIGYGTVGKRLTNYILRQTIFKHFCAGETADEVGQRVGDLRRYGIGGILDYCAESHLAPAKDVVRREAGKRESASDQEKFATGPTCNILGEAECDARTSTFLTCIQAVRNHTPGGFAAVKLSALGDPSLLSQLATCVQ